jgi:hypothetical protein
MGFPLLVGCSMYRNETNSMLHVTEQEPLGQAAMFVLLVIAEIQP